MVKTVARFIATAVAEIVGCYFRTLAQEGCLSLAARPCGGHSRGFRLGAYVAPDCCRARLCTKVCMSPLPSSGFGSSMLWAMQFFGAGSSLVRYDGAR